MNKKKFWGIGNSRRFQNLGAWLDESSYIIISAFSGIFFGIAGANLGGYSFTGEWDTASEFWACTYVIISSPYCFFIYASICIFFGARGTIKDQKAQREKIESLQNNNRSIEDAELELSEIKAKIQKLNIDSIELWLKVYSKQRKLTSKDRVSIYYEAEGDLYILARYSKNPTLKKTHKQKFPLDKGVISKAWEDGFYEHQLPEYESNKSEYIEKCCKEFGYSQDEIEKLTMKSRCYYAKAIIDADDHIGIILFESYNESIIEDSEKSSVTEFLESSSSLLANLIRNARKFDQHSVKNTPSPATITDEQELLEQAKRGG
ncbi:hypothetical protein [Pectobacterium polaris]|uniref:hypothetical protein n=1 Tax=Pectobacterium polaris TaxID=2042057 RepID=UPI000EA1F92A|nr:hypothetical protein [Pectobacterium polaris]RJL18997.1 hypothetical protein D5074_19595 [Pectobacterium polaris]